MSIDVLNSLGLNLQGEASEHFGSCRRGEHVKRCELQPDTVIAASADIETS